MANIVRGIRDDEELISACYLFAVHDCLPNPEEWLKNNFGSGVAELVNELHRLIELNGKTRLMPAEDSEKVADKLMLKAQDALLRKMVLAMCRDLRVVILRLSSRLQTLRYYAMKKDDPQGAKAYGADTLALYAPLANRLGIWQIKAFPCDLLSPISTTKLPVNWMRAVRRVWLSCVMPSIRSN